MDLRGMVVAPSPDKPPTHSESRWGRERGRSIPFPTPRDVCIHVGDWALRGRADHNWKRPECPNLGRQGVCAGARPNARGGELSFQNVLRATGGPPPEEPISE